MAAGACPCACARTYTPGGLHAWPDACFVRATASNLSLGVSKVPLRALCYMYKRLGMRVCHMMALHGGLNPKPQSDTTVTHGLLTPNHAKCIRRVLPVCSHVYDTYITE